MANRGEIFSLKFTKYRLPTGPAGRAKMLPRLPTCNKGPTSKGRGVEGKRREGKGNGREGDGGEGSRGKGRGREGMRAFPPPPPKPYLK